MLIAAASTTASTLNQLEKVPAGFWLRIGAAVLAVVILIIVLRKVAKMNKVILTIIVGLVLSIIGFNWIYERNEPAWATPVVNWLAGFLPTKGAMGKF
jgi:uncharacterized membrane protein